MYQILDKYTIKNEILPHLSVAKRGFITKSSLLEIVNCILYKLKSGCQWAMLPVNSWFSEVVLSYKIVFGHFRKWCKNGDWEKCWITLLDKHKSELDMSSIDIDGNHTTTLRGGEQVAYQGRKKRKTTSSLYLTDRQGIPLAFSSPVVGNHHDVYQIDTALKEMFGVLERANIARDGLFANADGGFGCRAFRNLCTQEGVFPNVAFNERNGEREEDDMIDELLYRERYSIERTNAWMDSYRTVLNRFDRTVSSWSAWNYMAFMAIFIKKIKKKQKSR